MKKALLVLSIAAALLCCAGTRLRADDASFYAARREALMRRIAGSAAVLQGAAAPRSYERFRQSNDFYYLTGIETPGAMLLIDAVERRAILFLPARDARMELWEGERLYPGAAAARATGIPDVLDVEKFGEELLKRRRSVRSFYVPLRPEEATAASRDRALEYDAARERNPWDGRGPREKAFRGALQKKLGASAALKDLSPVLDSMRRVKDELEISRMREAGRIGALGLAEAMRRTKPGVFEYQIAAFAEFVFKWNGAFGPAYFPLVGSGPNSCIPHYHANARRAEAGDLIVMDFGPDYRYYASDATRTFPVSGRFTEEQAKIYGAVLEAQKMALAWVRPGATFSQLNAAARKVLERAGYGGHWRHGVAHYIGMAVHDVGDPAPLQPGVALTVEPGVYIREKNLGVRIEDTVLVTAEGCEVLTGGVPKEIAEVEKLMAAGRNGE